MSQCSRCPLEINSFGILACSLPEDDVARAVEADLLGRWGYSEDFIRAAGNPRHGFEKNENQERKPESTDGKAELNPRFEDKVTCDYDIGESDLSAAGSELSTRARELYQQAEACYRSGQTRDSLAYIDQALTTDGVLDNTLLLTLKVKVLNSMGNYGESLRAAAKIKVENKSKVLLVEGATSLDGLDLLFTAEEWLKAAILDRSEEPEELPWTQKAVRLFLSVRNKRIYRPLIKQSPVTVSASERGRGVYANQRIAKGEIFSELPEFLEQSLTSQVTACAHCGTSLVKPEEILLKGKLLTSDLKKAMKKFWHKRAPTPCQVCKRVIYCSEFCRNEAWISYHKVICPSSLNSASAVLYDVRDSFQDVTAGNGYTWQGWWNAEFSPVFMARMWAVMLTQARLRAGEKASPTVADWLPVFTQVEKYSSNSETQVSRSVPKTFELMKAIFKRSKVIRYEITEAEFNKNYHKISMNYINFYDVTNPVQPFLDKLKSDQKHFKKMATYLKEPLPRAEFNGLFPIASCMNHSCLPNAEIRSGLVDGKPGIIVEATRDVSPLEEILISYVSPALGRKERRESLMRRYRFWCQCIRCLYEGDGPDRCTQCGKWAPPAPGSTACERDKTELDYLQTVVNVQDKCAMQIFAQRFESATPAETDLNPSDCNSRSTSEGYLGDSAGLETRSIKIDSGLEQVCGEINDCSSVCNHSNVYVSNGTHHEVLASNSSRESEEKRDERVKEMTSSRDNETDEHVKEMTSSRDNETDEHVKEMTSARDNETDEHVKEMMSARDNETDEHMKEMTSSRDNETDEHVKEMTSSRDNEINAQTLLVADSDNDIGSELNVVSRIKFPHCARCGRAWYCSQECQKYAWKKGHKKICGRF